MKVAARVAGMAVLIAGGMLNFGALRGQPTAVTNPSPIILSKEEAKTLALLQTNDPALTVQQLEQLRQHFPNDTNLQGLINDTVARIMRSNFSAFSGGTLILTGTPSPTTVTLFHNPRVGINIGYDNTQGNLTPSPASPPSAPARPAPAIPSRALNTPLATSLQVGQALALDVPGTSNIWLAGVPEGILASSSDMAPAQSPVYVARVKPGQTLTFIATGNVGHGARLAAGMPDPPRGGMGVELHPSEDGIAELRAPLDALVGVFLEDKPPMATMAPSAFPDNLSSPMVKPGLKQPFFIGDGLTGPSGEVVRQFTVPPGATRLYLGTMDTWGWYNNEGSFHVTVSVANHVPEESLQLLIIYAAVGLTLFAVLLVEFRKKGA